nr:DUF3667 domain-containing protein [Parahaliea mediterranea]
MRGEYCYRCGQREGRRDLVFSEAVGEAVGDLFNWDSRFWRTLLPLLFRPGFLTAEFIAGRRARYVPPFRIYLIISFVLFLVLSLNASSEFEIAVDDDGAPQAREPATGAADPATQSLDLGLDPNDPGTPAWLTSLGKRLETNAGRVSEDPRLFLDELLEHLPQTMFVMLPLFALLLLFCYALSPFHYIQHLVFGLHYHSFVYLLYLLVGALEQFGLHASTPAMLALLAYLPLALRRAYGSGIGGAIAKSLVIYLVYGLLLLFGLVLVSVAVVALM